MVFVKLYYSDYVTQVPVSASILHDATETDDGSYCLNAEVFSYIDDDGIEQSIEANEMYMIKHFEQCDECMEWCVSTTRTESGLDVCKRCLQDRYVQCPGCHDWVSDDSDYTYDGEVYCSWCFSRKFTRCEVCGEWFPKGDMTYTTDGWVCDDCLDEGYAQCYECEEWFRYDELNEHNGYWYCEDCFPEGSDYIDEYHRGRDPMFYSLAGVSDYPKAGNQYIGPELELTGVGCDNGELAQELCERFHVKCEQDCSIEADDGFEVIGDACTFLYHKKEFDWPGLFKLVNYHGHDARPTAGLHFHVSRTFLTSRGIGRIAKFIHDNYDALIGFGHRDEYHLDYCSRPDAPRRYEGDDPLTYEDWQRYCQGHGVAFNLCNSATIEFRFANSTTSVEHFFAVMEFVNAICEVSKNEGGDITWNDIYKQALLDEDLYSNFIDEYANVYEGFKDYAVEA